MTRALVLGGGGPVGVAWEMGVIAGLAEAGVDLCTADRIVGTSAGAIVGAQLGSPNSIHKSYAGLLAMAERDAEVAPSTAPVAGLAPLMAFLMRRPVDRYPDAKLLTEIGAFARSANTIAEADFVESLARLVPAGQPWPSGYLCTAVDAETGAFRTWDQASGVELTRAVASSCAVPGLYPPITIAGRPYIDGGIRSSTNTDLAAGYDAIVVLAVTLPAFSSQMAETARRELAQQEADESRTALIVPNGRALAVFGPNLMDGSRRRAVAEAGFEQGRAEAERVREMWAPISRQQKPRDPRAGAA